VTNDEPRRRASSTRPRRRPSVGHWRPDGQGPAQGPILGDAAEGEPTVRMPVVDRPPPATTGPVPVVVPGRPPGGGRNTFEVQLDSVSDYESVESRPYIRRLEQPAEPGLNWSTIAKVGAFLVLIVAGIWFVARLRSGGDGETGAFGGPGGPIVNPTVDELAQATVQILGLDSDGQPMCSGSGTFVSGDGLILTNAHVVTSDAVCDFTSLGVAVTADAGRPPEVLYRADLLVIDSELDLAVVRVSRALDPNRPTPASFPALALGDSDQLAIGDNVRILGYPEIGGETITFTNGSVSGFTAQAGIGDRALIKTDATIAGGNSGGAAVDTDGQLIGIPTKARASESGPAVDCRPLADTNSDGEVDDSDNCVPIGGFLNGIRPINLARELIDEAREAPVRAVVQAGPAVVVDPAAVTMSRPRFSIGQTDDSPAEIVRTAADGITELCLFVDWAGIPDGVEWDGIWWYNGTLIDDYSLVEQAWEFGEEGSNFWMCAIDDETGLDAGLYELGFFLNGQLIFAEGIVLTEEPVPVIPTVWENITDVDVCTLAINPSGSGQVGLNELPTGERIPSGGSATVNLPPGGAVVEATDCDGNPIADSAGTLDITEGGTYTIERPAADAGEVGGDGGGTGAG